MALRRRSLQQSERRSTDGNTKGTTTKARRRSTDTSKDVGTSNVVRRTGSTTGNGESGPPPLRQGGGKSELRSLLPHRTVELDNGSFMFLWRYLHNLNQRNGEHWQEDYVDMLKRALEAFEVAARGDQ